MGDIHFQCPACRQGMQIEGSASGLVVACIGCGNLVTVPMGGLPRPVDRPRRRRRPLVGAAVFFIGLAIAWVVVMFLGWQFLILYVLGLALISVVRRSQPPHMRHRGPRRR